IATMLIDVHNHLPSDYKIHLRNMLYTMCALAPHHTFFVRMKLTDLKILPEFALELTLTACVDVVRTLRSPLYLAGILARDAEWLKLNQVKADTIATLQNRLMTILKKELTQKTISLLLTSVLAEDRMRPTFANAFSKLVNPGNSDLYLIFAYLFNTNQFEQIQEICRETLTLDVMIAPLENESEAFIRAQFKEDILARCALDIEPTTSFTGLGLSKVSQDIAFEVFYVMLTGGVFHKGRVDIQSWILRQILQAEIPIHAKIGSLLKAYVRRLINISNILVEKG
ncbi:6546_t:CDS:2, partial [Scutellospora calospora]